MPRRLAWRRVMANGRVEDGDAAWCAALPSVAVTRPALPWPPAASTPRRAAVLAGSVSVPSAVA